ncbi:DUF6909 family protein [Ornatilinea apprima]|uniref:DUF6909 family protein n=1 Tax=Ornatilinea apprima TaxID=1134406 RepID=UPI000946479D|nr:hypothetical protein [Ornatilinea apprima]
MERRVPSTASEEIELYLQTVYSLLRSSADVRLKTLEEVHASMNSSLHPHARSEEPDTSALIYSLLRLPPVMPGVQSIVLGQSPSVFAEHGYADIETWQEVTARARRRRCYYNGKDTLACFIASRSDIDDVIPALTAYQIEWNKLNFLLNACCDHLDWQKALNDPIAFADLAERLRMSIEDLNRLRTIWGGQFESMLKQIASQKCSFKVRLLTASLSEYWRVTRIWLENILAASPTLFDRPIYFVSSNTHSIANLASGFALRVQDELIRYLQEAENKELLEEWHKIQNCDVPSSANNFLYYTLKKYQGTPQGRSLLAQMHQAEKAVGITRVPSMHTFDVEAQVIQLNQLDPATMDPRLRDNIQDWSFLKQSNALILNIDYPLGLAAYNIMAKIGEYASKILGVYIMGKAATLNGVHGDVIIPTVVFDEHSENTFMFRNAFSAEDVTPYLAFGNVLDNQKAVTVMGTFLQNARVMDIIYRESYTDIEMEAGPYLSAIYELFRPKRHPQNEIVSLHRLPFDLGILHYASDTPMSKGKNLGAGTLSYYGMDSTYATSLAILRRIIHMEHQRAQNQPSPHR